MAHRTLARLLLLVGGLLFGARAEANGKFPEAGQIATDAADPRHIVVRTTFGIMSTWDGGTTWSWTCEGAMQYRDYEPAIALVGGRTVIGLIDGLVYSEDEGCTWQRAPSIEGEFVVDLAASPTDPDVAIGITVAALDGISKLWRTDDGGVTWTLVNDSFTRPFIALTLDFAPNNPDRIYLSGLVGDEQTGAFLTSVDAGGTFATTTLTGSGSNSAPYIGALDPRDDNTVYVRLASAAGRLLVTRDGGATFATAFDSVGLMRGLAIAPDGGAVILGGESDGVLRAEVPPSGGTFEFQRVSDFRPTCLRWADGGIFACGHILFNEGIGIGYSGDRGSNFESRLCFGELDGALNCEAGSTAASVCPDEWQQVQSQLRFAQCGGQEPPPVPVGEDPVTVGEGGAGGAPVAVAAPPEPVPTPSEDGGCRTLGFGSFEPAPWASWLAVVAGLAAARRRRNAKIERPPV